MRKLLVLIGLLFSLFTLGQNAIKGIVYDEYSTVKGARVYNETTNNIEFSDDAGNFEIQANIGDNLVLHSLFHNKLYVTVEEIHFEEIAVFELTKFTNQLEAVELINRTDKTFDGDETNNLIENQISKDVVEKHFNYEPTPTTNMNLLAIAGMIGKLFKKKNKEPKVTFISSQDLITLFENDRFFNLKLLSNELKIEENMHHLFFEYCSAQNINVNLIKEKKTMELLELLLKYSEEFNKLIEASDDDEGDAKDRMCKDNFDVADKALRKT
ncbi:MAG: hypothetical protein AAF688_13520, partial [Bacteroidota bacterium]